MKDLLNNTTALFSANDIYKALEQLYGIGTAMPKYMAEALLHEMLVEKNTGGENELQPN